MASLSILTLDLKPLGKSNCGGGCSGGDCIRITSSTPSGGRLLLPLPRARVVVPGSAIAKAKEVKKYNFGSESGEAYV